MQNIGLLIVALFSPLITYLIAARRLSGRIRDSEASELWAESRSIREWSTDRVKELNQHVDELEERVREFETANSELVKENRVHGRTIYELRNQITELKSENLRLRDLLDRIRHPRTVKGPDAE